MVHEIEVVEVDEDEFQALEECLGQAERLAASGIQVLCSAADVEC